MTQPPNTIHFQFIITANGMSTNSERRIQNKAINYSLEGKGCFTVIVNGKETAVELTGEKVTFNV